MLLTSDINSYSSLDLVLSHLVHFTVCRLMLLTSGSISCQWVRVDCLCSFCRQRNQRNEVDIHTTTGTLGFYHYVLVCTIEKSLCKTGVDFCFTVDDNIYIMCYCTMVLTLHTKFTNAHWYLQTSELLTIHKQLQTLMTFLYCKQNRYCF